MRRFDRFELAALVALTAIWQCGCLMPGSTNQVRANERAVDIVPGDVIRIMQKAADWQMANPAKYRKTDWTWGAFFAGLSELAEVVPTDKYWKAARAYASENDWQLGPRKYHADDHTVGQMYLALYIKYRDPGMIAPLQERFDWLLANPSDVTLETGQQKGKDRYWWCDALFMGPPVWTGLAQVTGEKKYLDFMNREWWATTDYLYDTQEHLYYRDDRYFDQRSPNGAKIFWSRGNGWVFAGLARVLQRLPQDYPDRGRYETLFREMAAKLISIQQSDGLWRSSLLDAENYPAKETSGSGFYTYGLAWGVNAGLLDSGTCVPHIERAWKGLVGCVGADGKLGWVQPIGADPRKVKAEMTDVFGVGAFLLAGSEVYKLALVGDEPAVRVRLSNSMDDFHDSATVEIPWADVLRMTPRVNRGNVMVFDTETADWLVTQTLDEDGDCEPETLLCQVNLAPNEWRDLWVLAQPDGVLRPSSLVPAQAMFVPQRYDDFAWENDRIAFRMYGPALEFETVSSGIDVWTKSVDYPVLRKWYLAGDYHEDHGEGLDMYKVGPTRGCGGSAFVVGDDVFTPGNYRDYRILTNGPIRTVFELTYAAYDVAGVSVTETRRISLDLGSNLNRIECTCAGDKSLNHAEFAAGIVQVNGGGELAFDTDEGWLTYWQPPQGENGAIGCALIVGPETAAQYREAAGHHWLVTSTPTVKPIVYYAGAGWDKSGDFANQDEWRDYVRNFAARLRSPLAVSMRRK